MSFLRAIAAFAVAVTLLPPSAAAQHSSTGVDLRVELLSIVFRLAGNPEYNQCRLPAYDTAIDRWFAPYTDHEAVRRARVLRDSAGIGFDGVQSIAIHLSDPPELSIRRPLTDDSATIDRRWRRVDPAPFLDALRGFAVETRFTDFAATERLLYDRSTERLRELVATSFDYGWYERFFGAPAALDVRFVPGVCNGGANYGPRFRAADGRLELYAILGVGTVDSAGAPVFGPSALSTMIHEVNHSFVNPLMEANLPKFLLSLPRVYRAVAEDMRAMAYGVWETMLAESVVRAAVVRYLAEHQGEEAARREIASQEGLGYIWMGELAALLGEYEKNRGRYPTFASFVPRLADYYRGLAPRMSEVVSLAEARAPKVVSITPAAGAAEVDPATEAIVVRFDRPMSGGYSLNPGSKGMAAFPESAGENALSFDSTRTVFTWRVRLQPEREYEMVLNGQGFRSANRYSLRRFTYTFRTSKARPPEA